MKDKGLREQAPSHNAHHGETMSDTQTGTPITIPVNWDEFVARSAEQRKNKIEAIAESKAAIFAALEQAGIAEVLVEFDGYGDSGQIEAIIFRNAAQEELPCPEVTLAFPAAGGEPSEENIPLATATENLVYDLLEIEVAGWENNEGAFGDFLFNVAGRTIDHTHNERITDTDTTTYSY